MHCAQVNATVAEILDGKIADDAASDRAGRARGLLFEFAQGFFLLQGGTIPAANLRLCEFVKGLRQHAPEHPHLDVRARSLSPSELRHF
jgi:hypothetical protein